ncbi:hypothetical protein HY449_02740 [Candidatus Pacearchaeota archaeon]|nr:hypothetical protein [Candidatus Pacearchaeota archaeon]
MKSGFDINFIEGDGYLVLPLSMARLAGGQTPKETYETFHHFIKKLKNYSSDIVLLYTNGLYFNAENLTYEQRLKSNKQVLNHISELRNLIQSKKEFIPGAFHFLPIDYVILNSPHFRDFFATLKKREKEDKKFQKAIKNDLGKRDYNEANVNFILEEMAVAHIIRQRLVEFPRTLVRNDMWRLVSYPGKYLEADLYQWSHKILPQEDKINPYNGAQYDFLQKKLFVFDGEKSL